MKYKLYEIQLSGKTKKETDVISTELRRLWAFNDIDAGERALRRTTLIDATPISITDDREKMMIF
jgi:hypothetical protein